MDQKKNLSPRFRIKIGSPAMYSDVMNFYHQKSQHMCHLLFGTTIPVLDEKNIKSLEIHEQARIVVTDEQAQKIIDVLCSNLDYYPTKKTTGKKID